MQFVFTSKGGGCAAVHCAEGISLRTAWFLHCCAPPASAVYVHILDQQIKTVFNRSLCAFCREVVPTKPFTNTALYYKMMLESEPTPLATKWCGVFNDGSQANVGHYKMTLRNHFVVKTGCNEKS